MGREDGPNGTTGVRPYCNSHYTRHLLGLHALPLALSGQRYDAATASLSFNPRRDHHAPSQHAEDEVTDTRSGADSGSRLALEQWGWFTPQGSGLVQEINMHAEPGQENNGYDESLLDCARLSVLAGSLPLRELTIDGCQYNFHGQDREDGGSGELVELRAGGDTAVATACAAQECSATRRQQRLQSDASLSAEPSTPAASTDTAAAASSPATSGGGPNALLFYTCATKEVANQCEESFTLDQAGVANMGFSNNFTTIEAGAKKANISTLFSIHDTFFVNGKGLRTDWQQAWAALQRRLKPLIETRAVVGFFVGDELFPGAENGPRPPPFLGGAILT